MLRFSTSMMYRNGLDDILAQENAIARVQQQLGSGRRVLTPADDPLAAAQEIKLGQGRTMEAAYASNRNVIKQALALEDTVLSGVVNLLQGAIIRVIEAGNGAYGDDDWQALGVVLKSIRTELLNRANTMDSDGQYLFSGFLGNTKPYDNNANYVGNDGQRSVQIDQSRVMESSHIGTDIFNRATPGCDEYVADAAVGNTGTGTFEQVSVVPGGLNVGRDFSIQFQFIGGALNYIVTLGNPPGGPLPAQPYVDGSPIDMGGVSFTISGTPAAGDTFTVQTAQTVNMDLFATIARLSAVLETHTAGDAAAKARLENALTTGNKKLRLALDNVLLERASVGTSLNELEDSDSTGVKRDEFFAKQATDLTQLLTSATVEREMRKAVLEAALDSFRATQGLNLFRPRN